MALWNVALYDACERYPNMRVYDWASDVKDDWFIDGRHPLHLRGLRGARAPDRAGRWPRRSPRTARGQPRLRRRLTESATLRRSAGAHGGDLRPAPGPRQRRRPAAPRALPRAAVRAARGRRPAGAARRRARASRPPAGGGSGGRGPGDRRARRRGGGPRARDRPGQPRPPPDRALAGAPGADRRRRRSSSSSSAARRASRSKRSRSTRGGPGPLRLPGPVAARRRLRDARPLPRPPPDRADDRAARRRAWSSACSGSPTRAATRSRRPARRQATPSDEYERVQTPVYSLLYGLAQAHGRRAPRRRQPVGAAVADDGRRREPRRHGCAAGCSARSRCPARSGSPTASGSVPCAPISPSSAIGRAGFEAMADVVADLEIDAEHVDLRPHPSPRRPGADGAGRRCGTPAAGCTRPGCSARRPP